MWVCACGYVHVGVCMWVCACGYVHVGMCMWVCACGYVHVGMCMWVCACGYVHVGMCMWICACGYVHVGMCMWVRACGCVQYVVHVVCVHRDGVEENTPEGGSVLHHALRGRCGLRWMLRAVPNSYLVQDCCKLDHVFQGREEFPRDVHGSKGDQPQVNAS